MAPAAAPVVCAAPEVRGQLPNLVSPVQPSPALAHQPAHLLPLGVDDLGCNGGIGVAARQLDVIALSDPLGLLVDGQDGLTLPVGIWQSGLELVVG